jgi:hypothetical protein
MGGRVVVLLGGGGGLLLSVVLGASKGSIVLDEMRLALFLLLQACGFGLLLAQGLRSGGRSSHQAVMA